MMERLAEGSQGRVRLRQSLVAMAVAVVVGTVAAAAAVGMRAETWNQSLGRGEANDRAVMTSGGGTLSCRDRAAWIPFVPCETAIGRLVRPPTAGVHWCTVEKAMCSE